MLVGTIPIYHGTKSVKDHFNMDGIIMFDTIDDLENIISGLSKEMYYSKMSAVMENMEKAKDFSTIDWLYKYKKDFLENLKK
jgi:hypothetical protein